MYVRSQPSRCPTPRCRGFTIAEMVVAIFLTALLAVLMAEAAAVFARPAAEVDGRTRLALEASMAAEALARDLGGYLADNSGNPGNLTQYQFSKTSSWIPANGSLVLNYQGGTPPVPASVSVTYLLQNNALVRTGSYPVQSVMVASHVTGFNASLCDSDGSPDPAGSYLRIEITLTYPDPSSPRQSNPSFSGTYVLIGVQPPPLPAQ